MTGDQSGENGGVAPTTSPVVMCACCEVREAEVMATVPMCGERPRYAICPECLEAIGCDYAEDIEPIGGWT